MGKFIKREAIIAGGILLATIVLVFPAAYLAGTKTFGPFGDNGTLGRWLGSLFSELAAGSPAIWFFALSPLLAITVLRAGIALVRKI
ncbi:MAG: hypothetical protein AAFQ62_02750 [Pseudomonadota bacterium]